MVSSREREKKDQVKEMAGRKKVARTEFLRRERA